MTLDDLNALPEPEARQRLAECLDVPRWVDAVVAGRPYADLDGLHTVARVAADLDEAELEQALARHPRIGERAGSGHDAAHSAREQAGLDPADREVATRIADGNVAYEERFDRVFLIRASGRTGPQILTELERRLGNDDETERAETVQQLTEIAILRLDQLVGTEGGA